MTYDKETAHREIREAISAWVLDRSLPEPEFQNYVSGGGWADQNTTQILATLMFGSGSENIRLKPKPQKMIRVNGILCPAPETVAPAIRDTYFFTSTLSDVFFIKYKWVGDRFDFDVLEKGLVYLTEEKAITRSKAMLVYEVVV